MNKKISFLVLIGSLLLPVVASAQTIATLVDNVVVNVAWPVAIATIVIFWITTGILFLSALGSPDKLSLARKALIASVAGTIVIILAASAVVIIRNSLGL
ncbi:MAG: hypothetical protein ABIJ84_01665 [bacterium]